MRGLPDFRSGRHPASQPKLSVCVLVGICLTAGLAGCGGADSEDSAPVEPPVLTTTPAIEPGFAWNRSDYVVRCENRPLTIRIAAAEGWRARVGKRDFRSGSFTVRQPAKAGQATPVTLARGGTHRQYFIRCLPADFPEYHTTGNWRGSPRITVVQMSGGYAVALDRHGTPVWWIRTPEGEPGDAKFLPDGTFAYAPVEGIEFRHYVVRTPDGRRLRQLTTGNGIGTDSHDLQLLPNGNYLIGGHRKVRGVDTSRFGGTRNSTIDTAQVQEISPDGEVVWSWNAYPRISLRETGRWWKVIADGEPPYDIHHWNSIERRGNLILLSFRHLDAVYAIDRRSGRILWKLGGVKTNRSLRVREDERAHFPFGGQHDARFTPNGSVTVFDNATRLKRSEPRAVRYRIDRERRTATLVDELTDPQVGYSVGFGSARIGPQGNWIVGWGAMKDGIVGSYTPGSPPSRLRTPGAASYRANPVIGEGPTVPLLRRAMDRRSDRR